MIWSGYTQFIEVLNKHTKSKHPQEKSFHILQEAVKNALIPAKLKLTEFIASKLNCFLWGFQTDQPMVPFFCDLWKICCRLWWICLFIVVVVMIQLHIPRTYCKKPFNRLLTLLMHVLVTFIDKKVLDMKIQFLK